MRHDAGRGTERRRRQLVGLGQWRGCGCWLLAQSPVCTRQSHGVHAMSDIDRSARLDDRQRRPDGSTSGWARVLSAAAESTRRPADHCRATQRHSVHRAAAEWCMLCPCVVARSGCLCSALLLSLLCCPVTAPTADGVRRLLFPRVSRSLGCTGPADAVDGWVDGWQRKREEESNCSVVQ